MPLTSFLEADKLPKFDAYSSGHGAVGSSSVGGSSVGSSSSRTPPSGRSGGRGGKFSEKELKILR